MIISDNYHFHGTNFYHNNTDLVVTDYRSTAIDLVFGALSICNLSQYSYIRSSGLAQFATIL